MAAKLYITEFGERATPDTVNPIATLVELESEYMRGEDFPQCIASVILAPDSSGKRLDINYLGDGQDGPPMELIARFYIPHVPLQESESDCFVLKTHDGSFYREAISLEEWMELTGY